MGKGDARKAYQRALGKVGGDDAAGQLLRSLALAKQAWDDPKFIPHPSTWLNQERWEDGEETEPTISRFHRTPEQQAAHDAYIAQLLEEDRRNAERAATA